MFVTLPSARRGTADRLAPAVAPALAVLSALLLALLLTLGLGSPTNAATRRHSGSAGVSGVKASYDRQVLAWTNRARRQHGLRPLRPGRCLDRFASGWTRHLAAADVFGHQALGPILRGCSRRTVGENIAWGKGGLKPRQVVRMWMRSPGHRANILNPRFRLLGTDAWRSRDSGRVYVGQVFGG